MTQKYYKRVFAKKVQYKGIEFNSKLEADFAMFLDGKIVNYKGVKLDGADLFAIMGRNFHLMGLLGFEDESIVLEDAIPVPSYPVFLSLLNKEEADCVEGLKDMLVKYNEMHGEFMHSLNKLFRHYDPKVEFINDEEIAVNTLLRLKASVEELYSRAVLKFNRANSLKHRMDRVDVEGIKEDISLMSKEAIKLEKKMAKINNKIRY